jgi:hypothetical protein
LNWVKFGTILGLTKKNILIMKNFLTIIAIIILIITTSCRSLQPFSNGAKNTYGLSEAELKKVQFYLSGDLVLYRSKSEGNTATEGGVVNVNNSKDIEKVVIKAGTPGVLKAYMDKNKIAIQFEEGETKFLLFGNESSNGNYQLLAKEWKNGTGILSYDGKDYRISQGGGGTHLMFSVKKQTKTTINERKAAGVEVKE